MRNRKFNRVTCILLALCMMASFLLNAVSALETQAPGDGMHFVFSAAGYGSETDIGYDTIKSYDDYVGGSSKTPTWATNSGDKWRIDGACSTYEVDGFYLTDADGLKKDTDGDGNVDDVYEANALSFKAKGNNAVHPTSGSNKALYYTAVAITLDVAEAGNFIPSLTYHVGPEVPKCDVYLIQRSTSTVYDYRNRMSFNGGHKNYTLMSDQLIRGRVKNAEGAFLGTIDMYAEKEGKRTTVFPAYEIPEEKTGEYVLFLNVSNVNTAFYNAYGRGKMPDYIASIHSFDLTPAPEEEPPVISRAVLALDNTSLTVGGTAKASVEFFLEDETKYDKAVEYTLTSSDTNVATVDEKTGIVTAVAAGDASITASLASDPSVTDSVDITVAESAYLKELIPSEKGITLYVSGAENSITLTAKAKMNDNSVQSAEKYTLTFESSESGIARVESSGNIATVTAVSAGETNITISATNEKGEPCAASVPVYVKEKYDGIHFNFNAASWGKASDIDADAIDANDASSTPEFATANTAPWRIEGQRIISNYRITSESPDTENFPNAMPNALFWNVKGSGYLNPVTSSGSANAALVLRVKIDKAGVFTPSITYAAGPTSSNYAFFLAPVSARTSGYNCYANADGTGELGDVNITNKAPLQSVFKDGSRNSKLIEIGQINLYSAQPETKTAAFDPITIAEPGEYYLYLVARGRVNSLPVGNSNSYYDINLYSIDLYDFSNLRLVSTGAYPEADEIYVGEKIKLVHQPVLNDGRIFNHPAVVTKYTSLDESVATVEGDTLIAKSEGYTRIKVESNIQNTDNVVEGYLEVDIKAEAMRKIEVTAGGADWIRLTDKENDTVPMFITAITSTGKEIELSDADIDIEVLTPEFATVVNKKDILPVSEGTAKFRVTATHGGATVQREASLPVVRGKSEASYMTADKAAAVRVNAQKYDWAKSTAESAAKAADKYVDKLDQLWDLIVSEGIPRSFTVGIQYDPEAYYCRYCNTNLQKKYDNDPWIHAPFTRPWQIQCPECKRLFPSNDFGSFYKLGLNEYGEFDRMRALNAHRELYGDKSVTEPGVEHSAQWKAYYGYGNPKGFLYNELYQEIGDKAADGSYKVKTINTGKGLREGETVDTWGVDDGEGYVPTHSDGTPYYSSGTIRERHTYIAEYLFYGVWRGSGAITTAINNCANAYFYTGDKKYGRVAAILLDRLGDFYPQYDCRLHKGKIGISAGGTSNGKLVGRIWDTAEASNYIASYDKVFDMYEDEYVLDYIAQKSKQYKMRYAKETPSQIRTNIEDGLIRGAFDGINAGLIKGNEGMQEKTIAIAAVVLDTAPETDEWLDRLEKTGGIYDHLVDIIDNDGQGQEGAYYNTYQLDNLRDINSVFESNERYYNRNFANHPKYIKMHYANIPLMSSYYTPQIGDSHSTAGKSHWTKTAEALSGWKLTGDPIFAQVLYLLNGNKSEGLKYGITDADPERLEKEVQSVIDEHGTLSLASEMMPHFGFAMLRYGVNNTAGVGATAQDTRRDAWMYFGTNAWNSGSHAHFDTMNLGMTAYGLNLLPDLGYPTGTGAADAVEWTSATISHNTVVVNNANQAKNSEPRGEALHFDDDGTVSLMDVEASYVYSAASSYRRSVVNVKVDDENAYAVDFFRVLGGNSHLYSFHVQGNEVNETAGLDFTVVEDENGNYISGSQLDENGNYKGTYAGRDAKYVKNSVTGAVRIPTEDEASGKAALGENEELFDIAKGRDPHLATSTDMETLYPRGYTWLDHVDRDTSPEDKLEVDFAIKDFKKALKVKKDISLRITMLNKSNIEKGATASVAIANGYPPAKEDNNEIPALKYLLVENKGTSLDTVFTSVIEPYSGERYLEGSDELPMQVIGDVPEEAGDAHRAVKVKHTSGRVDYILWSTNNKVTYEITLEDGTPLLFRGFVGVYTVQNGRCTYQFLNDGDILGDTTDVQGAIEGTVKYFTKITDPKGIELPFENEIVITLSTSREYTEKELESLKNKYIYVNNGATTRSGTYKIEGATQSGDDLIVDVGIVTLVRKYVDATDFSKGFVYTIKEGQQARIPLTVSQNSDPVFTPMDKELTTSAGSSITVQVSAHSPIEEAPPTISYEGTVLPRGASLNAETGVVTWRPDGSQVGDNHFAITARDSDGRESTIHFNVTVYGSTTGKPSDTTTETPSTGNEGASGGGGGGGGAAPTPDTGDETDESLLPEEKVPGTGETDERENNAPDASGETDKLRFTDLSNHAWAADAINTLAEDGIIKGTSASTYSPANNITRADFALLLVRAFGLTSENTENFSDVSASDYFATELAIARNSGIVNGIGDNKFAPRNTITRQDMMVIVYRALQKQGVEFGIYDEPQYPDFATVADYAKPAVTALISAGLVNGKNGNIAPADYTTRAEVAVLIKRIIDFTAQ